MKKVIMTFLCFSASIAAIRAQDVKLVATKLDATTASNEAGKLKFQEESHNFGSVPEGPQAEYDFAFKNTGGTPVIISDAHGSCGCTVASFSKEPVLPGSKGTIHVIYNTAGRPGAIQKEVFVRSNADQPLITLHIAGSVTPKKTETVAVTPK